MMKKIESVFNLYYYFCYLLSRKLNKMFLSLMAPILKSEFMKRRQLRFGVKDPYGWYSNFLNDYHHSSMAMDNVDRYYFLWIGVVVLAIVLIINAILGKVFGFTSLVPFVFVLIPYILICGFALWFTGSFRKRYIEYFDRFEKGSNKERIIYKLVFWNSILATVVLLAITGLLYRK